MYIFYVFFLQSPERSGENMLFAKKERVPLCSDDASLLFVWRVLILKINPLILTITKLVFSLQ